MMKAPAGWEIVSDAPRAPRDLVARFEGQGTGPICDALGRFGALDYQIKPLDRRMRVVGSVLTVWTRPCDNLAVYKALELAQSGDVLVIATENYTNNTIWGELTTLIARARGLAGMITDGTVRDAPAIVESGLPVFARGLTPNSPLKDGPGKINTPITCGGAAVYPGDIVVGDADGVVVVPLGRAEQVLEQVAAIEQKEAALRAEIEAAGGGMPPFALRLLRDKGL